MTKDIIKLRQKFCEVKRHLKIFIQCGRTYIIIYDFDFLIDVKCHVSLFIVITSRVCVFWIS